MKFVSRREYVTFHSEGECDASFVSKYLGRQDWGDAAESDGFPGRLEIGQDTLNLGIHSHVSSWNQFMNYKMGPKRDAKSKNSPLKPKSDRFLAAPKPPGITRAMASSCLRTDRLFTAHLEILALSESTLLWASEASPTLLEESLPSQEHYGKGKEKGRKGITLLYFGQALRNS